MATPRLDALVERARAHKMSPAERRAQRISLIMGLRGDGSTLTHDEVGEFLDEIEGHDTRSATQSEHAHVG